MNKDREEIKKERRKEEAKEEWIPKTEVGRMIQRGEIDSYGKLLSMNLPVTEPQIIDYLFSELQEKVVDFKKTTKVRRAGRMFSFRVSVLVGDGKEYLGIGMSKDKEKWPAVRKATNKAKMNLIKVRKGCGSWECTCKERHSIPFKVEGKSASVKVTLMPAPKGTGLVVGKNIREVLEFVGIKDVWSKTSGATDTKLNFIKATIDALSKTTSTKISEEIMKKCEEADGKGY
ncbi:MAG: 30S ribosomal protein S5 [archaeon]